jgi:uncharacterized membrane protein
MFDWIRLALHPQFHLLWNLSLALVPFILSLWLFRPTEGRGWLWWPLLLVFVAFLPNAAYTATDVIHFIDEVRDNDPLLPEWSVVYVIIPKYAAFMFLGIQCHVISLIRAGNYLRWVAHKGWVFPTEIALNFLCAIGVYWGRVLRLNSWDIVTKPQKIADQVLNDMNGNYGGVRIVWYFCSITALYFVFKLIDLSVWHFWQERRLRLRFPVHVTAWLPRRSSANSPAAAALSSEADQAAVDSQSPPV